VRLAFHRHATSKLSGSADLGRIVTLGFRGRGEALAAIGQIADVTLVTRTRAEPAGSYIRVVGGEVVEESRRPAAPGTGVTVRNLFAHLPARRRFLRDPQVEAAEVGQVVGRFALATPKSSLNSPPRAGSGSELPATASSGARRPRSGETGWPASSSRWAEL
jgi:DNA mismatch repair protein MutL